jgi:acyl phosphate:glycerol-3-phosphate acyltransferase
MRVFLIIAVSYLLGSVPFGYLLVRIFRGEDVRLSGSGNIGATNVSRKSPVLGVLTLLLDALKGAVAVTFAMIVSPPFEHTWVTVWRQLPPALSSSPELVTGAALAALFAVLGHMFPVWLKFRGGKGVATGLGSFVLIAPKAVAVAVILFIAIVLVFRYVSLGSIISVLLFPTLTWCFNELGKTWLALAYVSLAALAIVLKHHQNIHRLLAGTERRIGANQAGNQGNQ